MHAVSNSGWVKAIDHLGTNKGVAIAMMVVATCFTLLCAAEIVFLLRVSCCNSIFRSTGFSLGLLDKHFSRADTKSLNMLSALKLQYS